MRGIKLSLIVMLVLAASALVLTGCGRKGLVNINSDKIAKDEFYARLERVPVQTVKGGQQVTVPAGQYVIEQMITEDLLQQLAKKENVAPTDAQIEAKLKYLKAKSGGEFTQQLKASGMTQEDWKSQMKIQQSVINLMSKGVKVTDEEVKKAYDKALAASPSPFKTPARVHYSIIVAETQDKIDKAYKMLQDKQEFGAVAMRLSEEKVTAAQGGAAGWVAKDTPRIPPQVKNAAFSTPVGTYTKPMLIKVGKSSGWLILKADQVRKATTESFDSVKVLLKEQIALGKADRQQFNDMLRKYIAKSNIKVNAERYKTIPDMMKKNAAVPDNLQPGAKPATATPTAAPTK
jgi:foldase protein PrsA